MRCVQPHLGLPGHSLIPLILPYKHNTNKHPAILSNFSFNPIHTDVSSIQNSHGGDFSFYHYCDTHLLHLWKALGINPSIIYKENANFRIPNIFAINDKLYIFEKRPS